MSISSTIYQLAIRFYTILPAKYWICLMLKRINVPHRKFYKDLKFHGTFDLKVGNNSVKLYHHGGTIENELFWNGLEQWERDTVWLWMELLPSARTVFDIGANTGVYSLVAGCTNPKVEIHAFEPSKNVYSKLIQNVRINGFDIHCHPLALSDRSGSQTFFDVSSQNPTSSSLSSEMLKDKDNLLSYEVTTSTLDDFIRTRTDCIPDLMKIDVEMHEPELMEGFSMIRECRPIIFIEILTDAIADRLNETLKEADVMFFELKHHELLPIPLLTKGRPFFWNFLVVPKERVGEISRFVKG